MNTMIKSTLCGLLALSIQANAAGALATMEQAVLDQAAKTSVGQDLEQAIGGSRHITVKAYNEALAKMSTADQLKVANAFNAFKRKAPATAINSNDVLNKAANSAFSDVLASLRNQATAAQATLNPSLIGITSTAPKYGSCTFKETRDRLMAGTTLSSANAEFALKAGLVIQGCNGQDPIKEGVLSYQGQAKQVAVDTIIEWETVGNITGPAALADAKGRDLGIQTTAEAEAENFEQLVAEPKSDCKVFPVKMRGTSKN